MKKIWKRFMEGVLMVLLVSLDQTTKYMTRSFLPTGRSVDLIKGVIGLRYVENTGAAFSSFSGNTLMLTILSTVLVLALAAYLLFNWNEEERFARLPVVLILSGGIGNLIDRVLLGRVTDFIELQFVRFAVFNIADVLISGGAVLLVILALLHGGDRYNAK